MLILKIMKGSVECGSLSESAIEGLSTEGEGVMLQLKENTASEMEQC